MEWYFLVIVQWAVELAVVLFSRLKFKLFFVLSYVPVDSLCLFS